MTRGASLILLGYAFAELGARQGPIAWGWTLIVLGVLLGWCIHISRELERAPNARARESGELLNPARGKKPMAEYVGALSCDSAECSLNYTGRCDRCGVELRAP